MTRLSAIAALILLIVCSATAKDTAQPIAQGITQADSIPAGALSAYVHARVGGKSTSAAANWALAWGVADADNYTIAHVSMPPLADLAGLYPTNIEIEVQQWRGGQLTWSETALQPMDDRYFSLKLVYDGIGTRLYGGSKEQQLICTPPFSADGGAVELRAETELLCERFESYSTRGAAMEMSHFPTMESIDQYLLTTTDPLEGKWCYIDRDVDQNRASIGGKYTLAIVKSPDGQGYDIVYLSGADKEPEKWPELRIKGRLAPTIFANNYDMVWIEAGGRALTDDNNAVLSADGALLTLKFPIYKSQLRLRRMP
ncbi:MAG: hypothetical protein LIP03_06990 [Bacteroidales bacterium]|nr:hypothetical protein [Bacteroidales bacterium]